MKIVSFSCDIYSDIVPAYHWLWQTLWPECPYDHVYVTNSKPLSVDATVHYIKGRDIDYGMRLRQFVKDHCADNELILLMMADYLLKAINIPVIEQARKLCQQPRIAHCRLRPMPHPQLPPPKDLDPAVFGQIRKRSRYALSLQPGIWRPQDIAKCIQDDFDPWHCETRGSQRTGQIKGMLLCTQKPAIVHHNYYRKRKPFGPIWVKENVPRQYWTRAARRAKRKEKV